MDNDVPWWVSVIIAWLPFIVLVGSATWMIRTLRRALHTSDGRSVAEVIDNYVRELQRANDLKRDAIAGQQSPPKS